MNFSNDQVWYAYILLCAGFHFFLQSRAYNKLTDWDSSSHLYDGFLRNKELNIFSSYTYGLKWIMPIMYKYFFKFFSNKTFDHRIINTFFGLFLILQFSHFGTLNFQPRSFLWMGILVLLINSLQIKFHSSATEFLDTPILLFIFNLIPNLKSPNFIILFSLIIIFSSFAFKSINILYVIPLISFYYKTILTNKVILSLLIFMICCGIILLSRNVLKKINQYQKSRGFIHPKGIRYMICNPFWLILNIYTSYEIILQNDFFITSIIITSWAILIFQKSLVSYFWYPVVIFNLYYWNVLNIEFGNYFTFVSLIVITKMSLGSIGYIFFPKYIEEIFYFLTLGYLKIKNFKQARLDQESINWVKNNLDKNHKIYLWGSKTLIPLACQLEHVEDTYFTHNHLFFWTFIKDKFNYAKNTILKKDPKYIIEAGVIKEIGVFPEAEFIKIYKKIYDQNNIKIFEKYR